VSIFNSETQKNQYIYLGDRWNPNALGTSTYVWLPLDLDTQARTLYMGYNSGWKVAPSGAIKLADTELVSLGKRAWGTNGVLPKNCGQPNCGPSAAVDGDWNAIPYGTTNSFFKPLGSPYSWTVDLGQAYDLSRVDDQFFVIGGSAAKVGSYIYGSNNGTDWTQIGETAKDTQLGFRSFPASGWYRYVKLDVFSVLDKDHNNRGCADWCTGLVEFSVWANTLHPSTAASNGKEVWFAANAGGAVDVTTKEVTAGAKVSYTLDSGSTVVGTTTANAQGVAKARLTIPRTLSVGQHTILATDYETGRTSSLTFTVLPEEVSKKLKEGESAAKALQAYLANGGGTGNGGTVVVNGDVFAKKPALPRDFNANSSNAKAIRWAWSKGIGTEFWDQTFRPSAKVSRGELAGYLYTLAGSPKRGKLSYKKTKDVKKSSAGAKNIAWAVKKGLLTTKKGKFKPAKTVTRAETATALKKLATKYAKNKKAVKKVKAKKSAFKDLKKNANAKSIRWLAGGKVITKATKHAKFKPASGLSRSDLATWTYRVNNKFLKK